MNYVDRKLSTGCIPIDDLLGGGIDRGSITQLYGAPASGKTNIALSAAAETVAEDKKVVYIEYPRKEIWTIGMVTGESKNNDGELFYHIFIQYFFHLNFLRIKNY